MELGVSLAISKGLLQTDLHLVQEGIILGLTAAGGELWKTGRRHLRFPCLLLLVSTVLWPPPPLRAPGCSLFLQALSLVGKIPLIQGKYVFPKHGTGLAMILRPGLL